MQKNKPTILFSMPSDFGIYVPMIENLKYCGFEVMTIIPPQYFHYPNFVARLATKYKKIILNQKDAKQQLKDKIMRERYLKQVENQAIFDYALFIRPDILGTQTIKALKNRVRPNHFVAYQWDGMNRFPLVWQFVDLFDRFFVFDDADLQNPHHHFLPTTNFYFDYDLAQTLPEKDDFYYIGAHSQDRMPLINRFSEFAKQQNWQLNFKIYSAKENVASLYPIGNVQEIKTLINLQENLEYVKQSRVLVDFVINTHKGLSLRVFEALGYRKKLITTNAEVVKYDFYHADNIYVLTENNLDGLPEFLAKPYHEIDPQIREKYSFSNWIRYLLNIQPHQAISLPS